VLCATQPHCQTMPMLKRILFTKLGDKKILVIHLRVVDNVLIRRLLSSVIERRVVG
jgi:hypothetical protein